MARAIRCRDLPNLAVYRERSRGNAGINLQHFWVWQKMMVIQLVSRSGGSTRMTNRLIHLKSCRRLCEGVSHRPSTNRMYFEGNTGERRGCSNSAVSTPHMLKRPMLKRESAVGSGLKRRIYILRQRRTKTRFQKQCGFFPRPTATAIGRDRLLSSPQACAQDRSTRMHQGPINFLHWK